LINEQKLSFEGNIFKLTDKGKLFADVIAAELFAENE